MPSQTAAERGEAELRILDFKTTWSEFQKPGQTAAKQGKAELRILDFKTTWSEFQKPGQTATGGVHTSPTLIFLSSNFRTAISALVKRINTCIRAP